MYKNLNSSLRFVKRQVKLLSGIAAGLLIGGASSAFVFAAVPSASGAVSLCYRTNGGQARVIDTATQSCNSNETLVAVDKATPGNFVNNLVESDFTGTSLAYRNFVGADLHGSLFDGPMNGSDFSNANLSSSSFIINQTISLKKANFTSTNFSNSLLRYGSWFLNDATFLNSNFNGTTWDSLYADGGNFKGASFTNANLESTSLVHSNFSNVDMRGAIFNNIHFISSDLTNADFSNVTLQDGEVQGTIVDHTNFTNVHFNNQLLVGSNFSTAILTGALWSNTICPDNTNSDNNGNTCIGHLVP